MSKPGATRSPRLIEELPGLSAWSRRRFEHVGSTAVPGLPAEPVIDIQVSVAGLDDESRYVAPVERAGVQLRSVAGSAADAVSRARLPLPLPAGLPRRLA